ncbi:hypothetical protein Q4589_02225 [Cobetia marina]|uniref:hypothetical protein n=1 Tax=Cobetia marina TaxID=28258 RepID=UPI0026E207E2|nr:hypothetical protein [Cobetia marina]MDO6786401.1 hypothetical protein [Cobetia marina]
MYRPFRSRGGSVESSRLAGHRLLVEAPMASSCREICWQLAGHGATLTLVERPGDDLALLCQLLPTPLGQRHRCLTLAVSDVTGESLCEQLLGITPASRPHTLVSLPGDGEWQLEAGRAMHVLHGSGWQPGVRQRVLECLSASLVTAGREELVEFILQPDGHLFAPVSACDHQHVRLHVPPLITGEESPLLMQLARHQGCHPISIERQVEQMVYPLCLLRAPGALARTRLRGGWALRRILGQPERMLDSGLEAIREALQRIVFRRQERRAVLGARRRGRGWGLQRPWAEKAGNRA